mmetsp:Transcript_136473/g.424042  ORF Transcript_136473/g.424042 Transcript_136473/m.424042 type:complete len:285 (-) Transcript_136473:793-1647(-)
MLQLGVVHVWNRHPQPEPNWERQPLGPLRQEGHAALPRWGVRRPATLLLQGEGDGAHPRVEHGGILGDELQGDEAAKVGVVLMDVQGEVFLVARGLTVEDVLQGDDLQGGVPEAGEVHRRRPRNRHLPSGGLVEHWSRKALFRHHGHLGVLRVRPEKHRLVDETAVVPVAGPLRAAGRVLVDESGRGPAELRPALCRVQGGAHKERVVAEPDEALLDSVVAVHEAVADVHAHAHDRSLARVRALHRPGPMIDGFRIRLQLLLRVVVVAIGHGAHHMAHLTAHSP